MLKSYFLQFQKCHTWGCFEQGMRYVLTELERPKRLLTIGAQGHPQFSDIEGGGVKSLNFIPRKFENMLHKGGQENLGRELGGGGSEKLVTAESVVPPGAREAVDNRTSSAGVVREVVNCRTNTARWDEMLLISGAAMLERAESC